MHASHVLIDSSLESAIWVVAIVVAGNLVFALYRILRSLTTGHPPARLPGVLVIARLGLVALVILFAWDCLSSVYLVASAAGQSGNSQQSILSGVFWRVSLLLKVLSVEAMAWILVESCLSWTRPGKNVPA